MSSLYFDLPLYDEVPLSCGGFKKRSLVLTGMSLRAFCCADTWMRFTSRTLCILRPYRINETKIIHCRDAILGFAGAATIVNVFRSLIRRHPKRLKFENADAIFDSSTKLRAYLKHYEDEDNEDSSGLLFEVTIVNRNGIFQLSPGGCMTEFSKFSASGCGSELALGAMHALYKRCDDPRTIAIAAVEAACEFSGGCGLPITSHIVGEIRDSPLPKPDKNGRMSITACHIDHE